MLDITLKHYVYDKCLDILFSNVIRNMQTDIEGVPKIGEFYSLVKHIHLNECYHNCIVHNVDTLISAEGRKFYMIYISSEYASGVDYDDWQEEIVEMQQLSSDEKIEPEIDEDGTEWGVVYTAGNFDEDEDVNMNNDSIEIVQLTDMIAVNSIFYVFQK